MGRDPGGAPGPVDGGGVGVGVGVGVCAGVDAGLQPERGRSAPRYAAHEVGEVGLDLGPGAGAGVLPAWIALRSVGGPGGVLTGARRDPLAASRCSDRRAPCPVSRSGVAGPTDHHRGREAGGRCGVEVRADVVLAKATVVPGYGGLLRRRDVVARIRETGEGPCRSTGAADPRLWQCTSSAPQAERRSSTEASSWAPDTASTFSASGLTAGRAE